ncbi:MAG: tRNA pseudouridine(55) synthase TruB [Balneolaceae bacterium]
MAKVIPLDQIPVFGKVNVPSKDADFNAGAIFLLDKPKNWSSFDVVKFVRSRIKVKKVGHAGTLDPMATGLLVLCSGKATKSISQIQELPKTYVGEITFGTATASYDAETDTTETADFGHITKADIQKLLDEQFSGEIEQIPPMYSALKYGGKKLYELARKGQEVERLARTITIHKSEILDFQPPKLQLRIECSKGTYIRSIAHDLGIALDSRAHLSALERTAIGGFSNPDALTPHELGDILESHG